MLESIWPIPGSVFLSEHGGGPFSPSQVLSCAPLSLPMKPVPTLHGPLQWKPDTPRSEELHSGRQPSWEGGAWPLLSDWSTYRLISLLRAAAVNTPLGNFSPRLAQDGASQSP